MYGLIYGFSQTNSWVWKGSIGPLMAFILDEYRAHWPPAQVAFLLGAFALGYVPLQIPYSLLARRTGQKILCTANLVVQAVGCALIPAAAAAGPVHLSAVYMVNGLFQGSRVPCRQVLERRWIPDGMERVRHQQINGWLLQGGNIFHGFLVPLLSRQIGWRVVTRWYSIQSAVMAVLWHLFAADTPEQWRGPTAERVPWCSVPTCPGAARWRRTCAVTPKFVHCGTQWRRNRNA